MTFEFDDAISPDADDGTIDIPHRWTMGPGYAHGGYLMSVALAGAARISPHPHPISMSAHFTRPGRVGSAHVDLTLVKAGRTLATVEADVLQDAKVVIATITTFGDLSDASDISYQSAAMPDIADRNDCISTDSNTASMAPKMAENLEMLLTPDSVGWTRGAVAERATMRGWIRFADRRPIDVVSLPMFADAFPPPAFNVGADIMWMPTIEFTLHFRRIPKTEWLAMAFHTELIAGPLVESSGTLWDDQGKLVAMSRQIQLIQKV